MQGIDKRHINFWKEGLTAEEDTIKVEKRNLFNDTQRERLVFHSIQYRNGWLAASDLFHMLTQSDV